MLIIQAEEYYLLTPQSGDPVGPAGARSPFEGGVVLLLLRCIISTSRSGSDFKSPSPSIIGGSFKWLNMNSSAMSFSPDALCW
mmetsp:Transcript_8516/g.13320  ORF Transcript_8516/g.13320 Transcript_8516/m.13320 type:complete len:83 (+) Transcript_8516:58-306(+)